LTRERAAGGVWRSILDALLGREGGAGRPSKRSAAFALLYERFREILSLNDAALETFAQLEDDLSGRRAFDLDALARRVRKTALDIFVMIKDLNQISGGQHRGLYAALERLNKELEAELTLYAVPAAGPLVLGLSDLRAAHAREAGGKMASLGEVRTIPGVSVPDGYVVTTGAFKRFMTDSNLWPKCGRLEAILEASGPAALTTAAAEVARVILSSPVPAEVESAVRGAHLAVFGGRAEPVLVAVRSSAVDEDDPRASHAGLYFTRLDVGEEGLLDAYREVIASAFAPEPVAYRLARGLNSVETAMAVGFVSMVEARVSGILFSRPIGGGGAVDPDAVVISTTREGSAGLTAGREGAELLTVARGELDDVSSELLAREEVRALFELARRLEAHFGAAQDIEWAIDRAGELFVLQSRALGVGAPSDAAARAPAEGRTVLLAGGATACPGVGSGPVVRVAGEGDLDGFPAGGVAVAHHSSPMLSRIMGRSAAIVCDIGSPTGHMAILAREFGVPTIVGIEGATTSLAAGRVVTVDASTRRVLDGAEVIAVDARAPARAAALSPRAGALHRIARLVTPLALTDPGDPSFAPEGCRSLHDLTRYVHERVFETMFHYGDMVPRDHQDALKLKVRLPIDVLVFDVGGGIAPDAAVSRELDPRGIVSVPMNAFLEGLLDPRIRWDQPRPVSMRGFLSVLGSTMAAPPAEAQQLGRASYAIISDRYLNFSTKAGYHFSTLDAYCGRSQNKNYLHFRFAGGAADETRRTRRVSFLSAVLAALDFKVSARRDLLVARLDKYDRQTLCARLADLGRLTLCVRQMDMLMSSDAIPELYARAFLDGEWSRF
jgi:pyruvate, water dikinase